VKIGLFKQIATTGLLVAGFHGPALAQAKPDASLVVNYGGVSYNVDTYGAGKSYNDASNIIKPLGLDFTKTAIWKNAFLTESIAREVSSAGNNVKYAGIAFPWDDLPSRSEIFYKYTTLGGAT
jgi:hypothetical protein